MNLAILIFGISAGGSERFATLLANGMSERGHHVTLLTGPKCQDEFPLSGQVNRVELFPNQQLLSGSCMLHRYLRHHFVDACVAIGIRANLVAALANTGLSAKMILCERNAPKEDHLSWMSRLFRRLLYGRGDAFVFQTPDAKAFYSESIQARGVVIPNPIKEGLPPKSHISKKEFVAIGRLMPQKNYPLLLQAFYKVHQRYPDYQLRIFGKGQYLDDLQKQATDLGISNAVNFEGFQSDVHQAIVDSDIYVLSSDFEGMPNALMEAMAMGFPVISTDCPCGGPRLLIQDGVNGLLTKVGDADSLSDAMLRYIEDPDLKQRCANQAMLIQQSYSLSQILQRWDLFLKKVIEGSK